MADTIQLDNEYTFLVGTYTDLDALAHQPYAPTSGSGIYTLNISQDGKLSEQAVTDILNPAVLIPHSNGKMVYAIVETIQNNGDVVQLGLDGNNNLSEQGKYTASGKSTCYIALSPQKDVAIVINYWDAIIDVVEVDLSLIHI